MQPLVYALSDFFNDVSVWVGDVYRQYGWRAALAGIVGVLLLGAGLGWLFPMLISTLMEGQ